MSSALCNRLNLPVHPAFNNKRIRRETDAVSHLCWVKSSPSLCCQHWKWETNPEVVVALKTLQEAFPLRVTTDGSIRLWWRQSAPGAEDLKAMGLGGERTHKHRVTTANHRWFNQMCNRSGSSLVSCQAHGLCTGDESEKAAWNRSYGLEWTAAAAAVHTGSAWMSPACKQYACKHKVTM